MLFIIIFGKILLLFARLNIICLQYVGNESPVAGGHSHNVMTAVKQPLSKRTFSYPFAFGIVLTNEV